MHPATDQSTERWLAAHLYYAEPWDAFLVQQVKPFVERILQERLARQFFFIRDWERGPHIRLRFQGEPHVLARAVRPRIEASFAAFFAQQPSQRTEPEWKDTTPPVRRWFPNHSIQFIPYEPEVERYGGPTGIQIAEEQFALSSHTVLDCMASSIAPCDSLILDCIPPSRCRYTPQGQVEFSVGQFSLRILLRKHLEDMIAQQDGIIQRFECEAVLFDAFIAKEVGNAASRYDEVIKSLGPRNRPPLCNPMHCTLLHIDALDDVN